MKKHTTEATDVSIVVFENLEKMVRGHVQRFVQEILEEEITTLLGAVGTNGARRWTPKDRGTDSANRGS